MLLLGRRPSLIAAVNEDVEASVSVSAAQEEESDDSSGFWANIM